MFGINFKSTTLVASCDVDSMVDKMKLFTTNLILFCNAVTYFTIIQWRVLTSERAEANFRWVTQLNQGINNPELNNKNLILQK